MKKILLGLFALLAVACGKDKTVEEYQREKLRENLALYESVAGSYTGVVTSRLDGSVLGAMELVLEAKTGATNPTNGEVAIGTPILAGTVRFLDDNITVLSAPNGFYDPATGAYSSQISITRASGGSGQQGGSGGSGGSGQQGGSPGLTGAEIVNLTGNLTSASLNGQISSANFSNSGGTFQLLRNGAPIEELLGNSRDPIPGDGASRQVSTYTGKTDFNAGVTKAVRIVILQPLLNTPEDFLNIVNPIKTVQASINYGGRSLQLQFPNSTYDTRQGLLTGQASYNVNGQTQKMTIDCRRTTSNNLRCSHLTSGSGITATTIATLDNGPTQDPQDGPEDRKSQKKTFNGKASYSNGDVKKIRLMVTLPSRTRFDDLMELFFPVTERIVQVTFEQNKDVTSTLNEVKFDTLNGVLDGSQTNSSNGGFTQYILCDGFFFLKQKEAFSCRFWSTRTPEIELEFKPPFN